MTDRRGAGESEGGPGVGPGAAVAGSGRWVGWADRAELGRARSDRLGWSGPVRVGSGRFELEWARLGWLDRTGLGREWLDWVGDWARTGFGLGGLGWAGQEWVGVGPAGLAGSGWAGQKWAWPGWLDEAGVGRAGLAGSGWAGQKWARLDRAGVGRAGVGWSEPGRVGWIAPGWAGLGPSAGLGLGVGPCWSGRVGLDWAGPVWLEWPGRVGWIGPSWAGLDWGRLGRSALGRGQSKAVAGKPGIGVGSPLRRPDGVPDWAPRSVALWWRGARRAGRRREPPGWPGVLAGVALMLGTWRWIGVALGRAGAGPARWIGPKPDRVGA
jgi:hypothetical protein